MNYSIEHLKIAYYSGLAQLRLDQVLEQISRQGTEADQDVKPSAFSEESPPPIASGETVADKMNPKKPQSHANKILDFLAIKGPEGASTKEIADALHISQSSISVWLRHATKNYSKTGEIEKVARARFCYCPIARTP